MKIKFLLFLLLFAFGFTTNAEMILDKSDMNLKDALTAIAKHEQLNLIDNIDEKVSRQLISQVIKGDGVELLDQLSDIYDFDWYIYGGTVNTQSGQSYINYTYRPRNIPADTLLFILRDVFQTSKTIKINRLERGGTLIFSGPRSFINDVVSYAGMSDNHEFLENGNNLEVARLEFNYLSVVDRNISSFDGSVNFPGAASLISSALSNMGQFENIAAGSVQEQAYKVKLSDGDKQALEEQEKTSKVQVLPGTNALLVRGTPDEITLAKRIASMIDVRGQQLMFSLKVYDVASERVEQLGPDNYLLNGSTGLYDLLTLPYSATKDFINNFQAMYRNGLARSVYSTNLLILENHQGYFGKKETVTINLVSNREVESMKIEADNGLYITGRILPTGEVQAKLEYVEEHFEDDSNSNNNSNNQVAQPPRVSSQSLSSEVFIKPEQTITLGGFDNIDVQSIESGVPGLSSIPLIGNLFTNTKQTKRQYKRYIAISFQVIN